MTSRRFRYLRRRFPSEIISHAVWLYYRYCLRFRDVEDLLVARGGTVKLTDPGQNRASYPEDQAAVTAARSR